MAVLFYQIGVFIAIQLAALFGKNSRNTAVILISIFTILQVFMSWLLLLQFITIIIAYQFSEEFLSRKPPADSNWQRKPSNTTIYSHRTKSGGRVYKEVDLNDENLDDTIRERAIFQKEMRDANIHKYNSDPKYKSQIDDFIGYMTTRNVSQTNKISLSSKFFYLERAKVIGPITAEKLIKLVKTKTINRNCFVRQESEEEFKRRAYEIVELLEI